MNKIIISTLGVLSMLFFVSYSYAQCTLANGTFVPNTSFEGDDAFQDGDVPGWSRWRGSPSIFGTPPSNTYAWMWSNTGGSEMILGDYQFDNDLVYDISFQIKTDDNYAANNSAIVAANASANFYLVQKSQVVVGTIPNPNTTNTDPVWSSQLFSNYYTSNWNTIQIQNFQPTQDFDGLLFFPLLMNSVLPPYQANMMIDNVVITPHFSNTFHFQTNADTQGTSVTTFNEDCDVYLNGIASEGEERHIITVYRRYGISGTFQWVKNLPWIEGTVGVFNLSSLLRDNGVILDGGYQYKIMLATQNMPCFGWEPLEHTFYVNPGANVQTGFQLTNASGTPATGFLSNNCVDVYLDASASQNYNNYFIESYRRPVGSTTWSVVKGGVWYAGQISGLLNLSNLGFCGTSLDHNYEYKIKFAIQNTTSQGSPCQGWMPLEKTFAIYDCRNIRLAGTGTFELETAVLNVELSPNPTDGILNIQANVPIEILELYDLTGKMLKRLDVNSPDISELSAGLYILRVHTALGIETKKVIKN